MPWKRLSVLNIGLVVGCAAALFIVPPSTSLRLFVWSCTGVLILSNIWVVVAARRRKATAAIGRDRFQQWGIWIALAFLILLMFLFSHGYVPSLTP